MVYLISYLLPLSHMHVVKQAAVEIEPITEEEELQTTQVESKDAAPALACEESGVYSQVESRKTQAKPGTNAVEQEVAYIKVVL